MRRLLDAKLRPLDSILRNLGRVLAVWKRRMD